MEETVLTPKLVAKNLLEKRFSLRFDDDPRLEAQPLYVSGVRMSNGSVHDVVYVCTMANNVWAFDANTGKALWAAPTNLGKPVHPAPHDPPPATEIDRWGINILWGILSTPVIDVQNGKLYAVCWTSADGKVATAQHELHEVDLTSGRDLRKVRIAASAPGQQVSGKPVPTFVSSRQKQRASLLLVKDAASGAKTVFVPFGMTHEEGDPTHGWILAYDVGTMKQTAAWCTSPGGSGVGVWQAGQGISADDVGGIYCMTGNYGVTDGNGNTVAPTPADLPESFVKLAYTPPTNGADGSLVPVAWFTPFRDVDRKKNGDDDFQDYDLGSAGPLFLTGLDLVAGAGKDGVLYVLPSETAGFGKGSDFRHLKQQPIFFTYFPGFGIDASVVANLDHLFDGKTHHLHGSPAFWNGSNGPMLFCWGENETLRAWRVDASGTVSFMAKGAEVASANLPGTGGMPGGLICVSANGTHADTGIVWALAPIDGDANRHIVRGVLRAYDAAKLDPVPNADGTPRLKLLWQSTQIPGNNFNFCKFCPPVVADGKVLVPTYDGRVDVYTIPPPHHGPKQTNSNS